MTYEKKSKTIYTDLKFNKYMTDDRNQKSGTLFPNFVFMIIVIKKLNIIFGVGNQNIVLIIKKFTMNIYMNILYRKFVIIKIVIKQLYIIFNL